MEANKIITIGKEEYNMIHSYKENEKYRNSFFELAKEVHGIDFSDWYEKGFWGERYNPYSLVYQDKVVANVSVNKIDFKVDDKVYHTIQIGTVMTDRAFRNKGLSRVLMEAIMKEYDGTCDLIYLFANDTVLDFYPKFGFTQAEEYGYSKQFTKEKAIQTEDNITLSESEFEKDNKPSLRNNRSYTDNLSIRNNHAFRKLNMFLPDDYQCVLRLAQNTCPSAKISMINNSDLSMFYLISFMAQDLYYCEELDLLAVAEIEEDKIFLMDIFCVGSYCLDEVISSLLPKRTMMVSLGFTPIDEVGYTCERLVEEGTILFVKGTNFIHKGKFPILSHA